MRQDNDVHALQIDREPVSRLMQPESSEIDRCVSQYAYTLLIGPRHGSSVLKSPMLEQTQVNCCISCRQGPLALSRYDLQVCQNVI